MTDLAALLVCILVGCVVLSVMACAICAGLAVRFYAEERRARRAWRPLSPHVPLQPMREDPSIDALWETYGETGETELDRRRAQREARDSEQPGC